MPSFLHSDARALLASLCVCSASSMRAISICTAWMVCSCELSVLEVVEACEQQGDQSGVALHMATQQSTDCAQSK
jgi:hypothetical protein